MSDSGQENGCQVAAIPSVEHQLEEIHKSIARCVVSEGLPFEMVESRGYIRLMYSLRPEFKLPSALTLSKICFRLYLNQKLKLQDFMKSNCQSVCLSTDAWNSPQGVTYMTITAHFIDENWKLQRKVLSFLPNDFRRGEEIGVAIEECLAGWGIKKVCTIAMENTKTNDDAIVYLKEKLIERGIGFSGCKYLQVKCCKLGC